MKHIFIVNPMSGSRTAADTIKTELRSVENSIDCEIYLTKGIGDAERYIKQYLSEHTEAVRFYACGGDGTVNEVVNGIMNYDNASFTVYPCGSGNDFVKTFGDKESFLSIKNLVEGKEIKMDVMKVGERYCINICHFGFDSYVAKKMNEVRKIPLLGGKNAYTTGVMCGLVKAMKSDVTVFADGRKFNNGELLLCTAANGNYVGGKYKCAPRANVFDGLIDLCLVDPVPRTTFVRLINAYAEGKHLDDPRFGKFVHYTQCKSVEIIAPRNFNISIDGEVVNSPHTVIKMIPNGINFAVPV